MNGILKKNLIQIQNYDDYVTLNGYKEISDNDNNTKLKKNITRNSKIFK